MNSDSGAVAAWYADPTRRHEHRYWNGTAWTDQVSDRGVVGTDPLEPAPHSALALGGQSTSTGHRAIAEPSQGAPALSQTRAVVAPGKAPGAGSLLLNILWFVLAGFWLAMAYVIAGIIQCIFIITIPFGVQSFKLAGFALWPFGRAVVKRPGRSRALSAIGNFIWFFFAGIWLALTHLLTGLLLCVTVIGIPLGLANFKMVPFALVPFGKDIVRRGDAYGEFVAF